MLAVEKGAKNSKSSYISYFQRNGRKAHIYLNPGDHPYMGNSLQVLISWQFFNFCFQVVEETNLTDTDKPALFYLASFVTPDKLMYSIETTLDDDYEWKESIHLRKYL